jgi:hypothetical protein
MKKMKKNCWEYKACKQEITNKQVNMCPACVDTRFDGIHGGICAGRACWVIEGTMCDGSVQGDFIDKYKQCGDCDFYEHVKKEEGNDLSPTVILLKQMEKDI